MGLPILFGAASWAGYEPEFRQLVAAAAAERATQVGVFGDIDMDDHRAWVERVTAAVGARAVLPLWRRARRSVMADLLAAGFEAVIVAVREDALPPDLLGRTIDAALVEEIEAAGADAAGESGEYHSVVVEGPLFERRLRIEPGERSLRDGVWFLDLRPA
jgi:uncharacterized protein (TIGR00290 family)